ncbi:MAG: VOC family protein [Flavobacteriales bacterium]
MKLQSFTLQIFEPEQTLSFYTQVLGFKQVNEFTENNVTYYNLCFKNTDFHIQLKYSPLLEKAHYKEAPTDNYWKYSLFVDDIQKAYQHFSHHNMTIGEPFQFGDIGYLAHTKDVENHQIEYIQKTFKQNAPITTNESTALGLLTIRTKDPIKIIKFYEDILDLKLFVRMYVNRGRGFTLYFLGNKNLEAPTPDIDAIENREWMYQQSHLFIEIQHFWNSEYDLDFDLNNNKTNGLQSINFYGDIAVIKERLQTYNITFQEAKGNITFETIDKHVISIKAANNN